MLVEEVVAVPASRERTPSGLVGLNMPAPVASILQHSRSQFCHVDPQVAVLHRNFNPLLANFMPGLKVCFS